MTYDDDEDDQAIAVLDAAIDGEAPDEEVEDEAEEQEPDETPPAAGDAEEEEQTPDAVEDLAREMGWAPEDEWRGDPAKHVDAREFIKNGPEILRATLRRQDQKLDEVADTMKGMARAAKGAESRAYDKAVADLKSRQEEAVVDGDVEEFRRIDTELEGLDKPEDAARPAEGGSDPLFDSFQKDNEWYGNDYEKSEFADRIASHVGQKFQGEAFYAELTRAVNEKFPAAGNPKRRRPSSVEGGGETRVVKPKTKTYNDLPTEARAACDEFVDDGIMTKEDYVKDFFADEEAA